MAVSLCELTKPALLISWLFFLSGKSLSQPTPPPMPILSQSEAKNPRINQLSARWQQVWLLALERQRKLNDALDRLEEVRHRQAAFPGGRWLLSKHSPSEALWTSPVCLDPLMQKEEPSSVGQDSVLQAPWEDRHMWGNQQQIGRSTGGGKQAASQSRRVQPVTRPSSAPGLGWGSGA